MENQYRSYGASPAIWAHTVLPATLQVNVPHLNPRQRGWYPKRREGRVDLGVGYGLRVCRQTVTYPSGNSSLGSDPTGGQTKNLAIKSNVSLHYQATVMMIFS